MKKTWAPEECPASAVKAREEQGEPAARAPAARASAARAAKEVQVVRVQVVRVQVVRVQVQMVQAVPAVPAAVVQAEQPASAP